MTQHKRNGFEALNERRKRALYNIQENRKDKYYKNLESKYPGIKERIEKEISILKNVIVENKSGN